LDDETLDVLAQEGMRFTVVAPGQVKSVPNDGRPGRYTTSNGRSIALCIYDGDISHGIAFGAVLRDAHTWAKRMLARTDRRHTPRDRAQIEDGHWEPEPGSDGGTRPLTTGEMHAITASGATVPRGQRHRLVSAATDGETYGHHHRFSEMALARVVLDLSATRGVKVENYATFLADHPADDDVEIVAPSAWSCAHGVERWRSNCSCRMRDGTNQEWRTPLRDGITELAEGIHRVYEREASRWFDDPWAVRDAYGEVAATPARIADWVAARVKPDAVRSAEPDAPTAQSLLEMERGALRIFTSCAWFFDDIAGLEPIEVLRYAARAIELAGPDGPALEAAFLARLSEARSSDPGVGTGRDVYLTMARPSLGQFARLAGSVAAARAVAGDDPAATETGVALRVSANNGTVTVEQYRSGDSHTFEVSVLGLSNGAATAATHLPLGVTARVASAPPLELTPPEMTERQRSVVERGIRRRLVAAAFGDDTAVGQERDAGDRLDRAVVEGVTELARSRSEDTTMRVIALLDLLELDGRHVPFDAQTRFYDAFLAGHGAAPSDTILTGVAHRLGFAALTS
ncbi:MAG TPA: DUF3536 domain-containing protein, partial [Gemmatimonadaceae bacterium]|nr:DUF3536 domain-containing protein [Gemmatimonadaceae bacterium]